MGGDILLFWVFASRKKLRIFLFQIMVRDLMSGSIEMHIFDAVICCNGHYSCPRIPKYSGQDIYEGKILHSHSFRTADAFKGFQIYTISKVT